MRRRLDAAELGIGDVVLGDDVGDQRAHAHEPAADADQHQRQRPAGCECCSTLTMKRRLQPRGMFIVRAAADRQHRPEIAEHDQQHEGDDVVGDRMEAHRHDAGEPQRAAVAVVAGEAAQQVAEHPGQQGRDDAAAPTVHGSARPISVETGVGKADSDGPKSPTRDAPPEHQILLAAARPPARTARAATGASCSIASGLVLPNGVAGGDRLLDRIDRRRVGDDEGDVDADEDDQRELAEPRQQVGG